MDFAHVVWNIHKRGLILRDLKTDNVMYKQEGKIELILIDLGALESCNDCYLEKDYKGGEI